jgi:hypothetical protein
MSLFTPRKGWARLVADSSYRDELANYLAIERWANSLKISGGGGGGGKEYATVVVAASDTHASGKTFADFVCTGTDDHLVIQQAVDTVSLLGGGNVLLLEGQYHLGNGAIDAGGGPVWLCGCGPGTHILFDSASTAAIYATGDIVFITDMRASEQGMPRNLLFPEYWIVQGENNNYLVVERCVFELVNRTAMALPGPGVASVSDCTVYGSHVATFVHATAGCMTSIVNCLAGATNTLAGVNPDLAIARGVVANCVVGSMRIDSDTEPVLIGNTTARGNAMVERANAIDGPGGPLLIANSAFQAGVSMGQIDAPVQYVNCVFKPLSTVNTSVVVAGPVAGYVQFEGCLFDHRGNVNGRNLAIGETATASVTGVSVMDNRFIGSPVEHVLVGPGATDTVIVGNVFVGSSPPINNSGTNTHLTLPTGPQGNNFVIP